MPNSDVKVVEKEIEGEIETVIDEARVVNFSDAVFAFAATLLVLKIDLPNLTIEQATTGLPQMLIQLWPSYFANIISFVLIAYYWINHHALFRMIKKFNVEIVWINILFLICIAFLPFPVDLFGEYSTVASVVMFYAASLAITGYLLSFMWWYAAWPGKLVDSKMSSRRRRYYLLRNLMAPVIFTISVPIAYFDHIWARFSWILLIVGLIVIHKAYKYKHLSRIEEAVL
ncbi:DUF1211 domain-containing protein [Patescibacteria group bacterium]|mgnify:CR=1 FL=1|nr:DUF1211 domain-containing protein [Patescibacteria group bacterium]